jgi:inner membrane protein
MDILSHTFTGIAVGAGIGQFAKGNTTKWTFVVIGALGGAFPDIDAISLWSKFDGTIGKWLHLSHSGEEIYCGKFWYSHHGFFHSLLAMALFGSIFFWVPFLKNKFSKIQVVSNDHHLWAWAFFLAGTFHLLEDMPTPDNIWGGVRLFFPFEVYIGGWNDIWWWNNYDLFLIIFSVALSSCFLLFVLKKWEKKKWLSMAIFAFGIMAYCYQVHRRPPFIVDAFSREYDKNDEKSMNIQKEVLPPFLFNAMQQFDQYLPLYF